MIKCERLWVAFFFTGSTLFPYTTLFRSRAEPGKSGLHAHGEGELVITLESWEAARSSRGVEEGLSRSFSGCGGKPSFPSTSAGDYRELTRVTLRGEECCGVGRASRDSAGFGAMEEGLISRGGGVPIKEWPFCCTRTRREAREGPPDPAQFLDWWN